MAFCRFIGAGALGLVAVGSSAFAGYTVIQPPHDSDPHNVILSVLYGGTFQRTGTLGLDFSNGTTLAHRVEDFAGASNTGPVNLTPTSLTGDSGTDDQLWSANFTHAAAEVKYAVFNQNFGYYGGTTGTSTYHQLFVQSGFGYNVQGEADDLSALAGQTLRWARGGEGRIFSSVATDNGDGADHMVTYEIESAGSVPSITPTRTWLLFFEDKFVGEQGADWDYNDLVVQVTASVPEPASLTTAILGAGVAVAGRRRRLQ